MLSPLLVTRPDRYRLAIATCDRAAGRCPFIATYPIQFGEIHQRLLHARWTRPLPLATDAPPPPGLSGDAGEHALRA